MQREAEAGTGTCGHAAASNQDGKTKPMTDLNAISAAQDAASRTAHPRRKGRLALAAAALCALSLTVSKDSASANERVVTDWQTGLAISGYDPVAYFVEGQAVAGKPDYEAQWNGVVWRFRSLGNRDAFVQDPEVYAPEFGGHDAIAISEGYVARGNPLIWTVDAGELHLFNSPENLAAFREAGPRTEARADKNWSALRRSLALR